MKNIFFCLLTFFCLGLNAQQIYFGYPIGEKNITCGDKIIVNIPTHKDGRFLTNQGIEKLTELLNGNKDLFFKIDIFDFQVSEIVTNSYTDFICDNMANYLDIKCLYYNYVVNSCGNSLPLFCFSEERTFKMMNTRMEISVKCNEVKK